MSRVLATRIQFLNSGVATGLVSIRHRRFLLLQCCHLVYEFCSPERSDGKEDRKKREGCCYCVNGRWSIFSPVGKTFQYHTVRRVALKDLRLAGCAPDWIHVCSSNGRSSYTKGKVVGWSNKKKQVK